jgi:3'-5' exoribonuclease
MDFSYKTVKDLKSIPSSESIQFEGVFLLKKTTSRTARNGNEFTIIEVSDCSGSFSFNVFGDTVVFQIAKELPESAILKIEGTTNYYQERFSPKVHAITVLDTEVVVANGWMEQLVTCSLENPELLWEELQSAIQEIQHIGLRATVMNAIQEVEPIFRVIPAAISMHHAYRYGLLEHTVHMVRAAKALLPLYKEIHVDLALAGVILHDIGKTIEYEGTWTIKRSKKGLLQGHVVLGYRLIRKAAIQAKLEECLTERLEHIVLSHQGELEWGAAILAATPEAIFVSMIDHMDAKLGMVQYALRYAGEAAVFSDYLPGLQVQLLTENNLPTN